MKNNFLLLSILFFTTFLNTFAQHVEQIVPLSYNKQIIEQNKVDDSYKESFLNATEKSVNANYPTYYFYEEDTLTIPFADDFSRNYTFDSRTFLYTPASQSNLFPRYNFKVNNAFVNSISFNVDTAFSYQIIANNIVKTALSPLFIDTFVVKLGFDINIPLKTYLVWPAYYIVNIDTIGGVLVKIDSILKIDYTWTLDTFNIYKTKLEGKKGYYLDNNVLINNNFAKNQITQGVATFDGIASNGLPYNNFINPNAYGIADVLTSKKINLAVTNGIADSVYFSFYYQLKGYGNAPNSTQDSLVLEFKSPLDTGWSFIWKAEPPSVVNDSIFTWKNILVNNIKFLKNGFQFRFKAYGTLSGAFDHWHLDYIYLNKNRKINDDTRKDIAFVNTNQNFFNGFTSLPYKQYSKTKLKTNINNKIRNYDKVANLIKSQYDIFDNYNSLFYSYTNGAVASVNIGVGVNQPFGNPAGFNFLTNPEVPLLAQFADSQVCKFYTIKQYVSLAGDVQKENDTVIFKQYVSNYLSYDDGSAEAGYKLVQNPFLPDGRIAYKVSLTTTDILTAIRFYFLPQEIDARPESFLITIWEDDGTGKPGNIKYLANSGVSPLYGPLTNYFHEYAIPNVTLDGGKNWFIGFQQTTTTNLNLGLDLNTISNNNMYYNVGNGWFKSLLKASFMIRPVFGSCPFETGSTIGLENINNNNNIKNIIYPNPANNSVSITNIQTNTSIEIYNTIGSKINFTIDNNVINVQDWPSGLYYIKLASNNKVEIKKLIIAH